MATALYSSLAAFLAHFRALESDPSRTPQDELRLAEMSAATGVLTDDERAVLKSIGSDSAIRRRRERAEFKLRRELIARGILSG